MSHIVDTLLTDLRSLVTDLGKDGGLMGASIYDTAQVLRLYPAQERIEPAIGWLLGQQQADGGWGYAALPHARDAPTLATILALHAYTHRAEIREALHHGLAFLADHAPIWLAPLPSDLPTGIELVLPKLLDEAASIGLAVAQQPYAALMALGERRRQRIRRMQPGPGSTPAYSWEAWGATPDPALLDPTGGVGHSPAATAAWLRATGNDLQLVESRQLAERYLRQAAAATITPTSGVFPSVWPITRYEQAFAWYALLVAGLLKHPALADVVQPQLAELSRALQPAGLGFTDFFIADGDDTAAAIAVLQVAGYQPDLAILQQFADQDHFRTYPHELQASITTTARAIHALALAGEDVTRWYPLLLRSQQADGRWSGDKWNSSWTYTTWHVLLALQNSGYQVAMQAGGHAFVRYQHEDGGWGIGTEATAVETAYGVLALYTLIANGLRDESFVLALRRGYQWLLQEYQPGTLPCEPRWINKELFCPPRIDRVFILSALLVVALNDDRQSGDLELARAI
ncbi:MAG TPA: prenyltransferase/squalene oxidase repeat-containing protein [Herpetosiphonaceae bacterium]